MTNGQAVPATKRAAPRAGPTISFMTRAPIINRALPVPRSARRTTVGSSVPEVVSAKTSATPRTESAARTTAMQAPSGVRVQVLVLVLVHERFMS